MTQPFIGEIHAFGFTFAPRNYAFCNGQLMSIAQNTALFSILGTTYGGNGQTTFALPDLRGRSPVNIGPNNFLGQTDGEEFHALTVPEIGSHRHQVVASSATSADVVSPATALWANGGHAAYSAGVSITSMRADAVSLTGGGLPHENRPPYLVINYCIALFGIFPSRN